jgi:outer membrane protein OmpA-like peptidoglycan-associated protein
MRKLTSAFLLLVLLPFLGACATTDREPRRPDPEETAAAEPEAAPPAPAPEPEPTEDPAIEASRRAEEEVEQAPPPPPPAERPSVFEVPFGDSGASLSASARAVLDALAARLHLAREGAREDWFVELQGHTDSTGSEEANLRLAELRAEEVRAYLHREKGLPPDSMEVVPYGSAVPVGDNSTADGRAENRRVAVVLIPPPP